MLTTVLAGLGIDFVTDLIKDKGEDLVIDGIKSVTGIDLKGKTKLTPDEIQKIKDSEIKIKEIDFKNTDSARRMNTEIQVSENTSALAKNAAYYLDFMIVGASIIVGFILFFKQIPVENKELAYTLFGSLLTMSATILNFHRGSTQGSKDKTKHMQKIGKR